jgi:hypothetical protein
MLCLKCPKCQSKNTKKVSVGDPAWYNGHQRCLDCSYQEHWGLFCDPPIDLGFSGRKQVVIE